MKEQKYVHSLNDLFTLWDSVEEEYMSARRSQRKSSDKNLIIPKLISILSWHGIEMQQIADMKVTDISTTSLFGKPHKWIEKEREVIILSKSMQREHDFLACRSGRYDIPLGYEGVKSMFANASVLKLSEVTDWKRCTLSPKMVIRASRFYRFTQWLEETEKPVRWESARDLSDQDFFEIQDIFTNYQFPSSIKTFKRAVVPQYAEYLAEICGNDETESLETDADVITALEKNNEKIKMAQIAIEELENKIKSTQTSLEKAQNNTLKISNMIDNLNKVLLEAYEIQVATQDNLADIVYQLTQVRQVQDEFRCENQRLTDLLNKD